MSMSVTNMRAELMKAYPDSASWKHKCKTWPEYRIISVYNQFVKEDRWKKNEKKRELAKQQASSEAFGHQYDLFELNLIETGGNNE